MQGWLHLYVIIIIYASKYELEKYNNDNNNNNNNNDNNNNNNNRLFYLSPMDQQEALMGYDPNT